MKRPARTLAVGIGLLLTLLAARSLAVVPVGADTLAPRVRSGDVVLVDRLTYALRLPYRGEIVVSGSAGEVAIDRVVGIGGDTVAAARGKDGYQVLLNDAPLGAAHPLASRSEARQAPQPTGLWRVAAGFVQVMDDDGRHLRQVSVEALRGRALFVLYPLDRRGWLL